MVFCHFVDLVVVDVGVRQPKQPEMAFLFGCFSMSVSLESIFNEKNILLNGRQISVKFLN